MLQGVHLHVTSGCHDHLDLSLERVGGRVIATLGICSKRLHSQESERRTDGMGYEGGSWNPPAFGPCRAVGL